MGTHQPRVVAVPFPAQGHVIPMMKLAKKLVQHGLKVIIINSDLNHRRIIKSSSYNDDDDDGIRLVSFPDGLENWNDKAEVELVEVMLRAMEAKLEELIQKINEENKITDGGTGWALEIAKKMGTKGVAFSPASATNLAVFFSIPKLIEDGNHKQGWYHYKETDDSSINHNMPAMNTSTLPWACVEDATTQKRFF